MLLGCVTVLMGAVVLCDNLNYTQRKSEDNVNVVVNFLSQVIFVFLLFLGMVMYANEVETKEKEKLPEIKNNYNTNTCLNTTSIYFGCFSQCFLKTKNVF